MADAKLNVLIVDDEAPARKRLRKLLDGLPATAAVAVVDEARDGNEALRKLDEHAVDLVFLDIQMPGLNGFDVVERLDPEDPPAIVFTTAFDEYAIQAFEANAIDYLQKPIARDRLRQAVERGVKHRRTAQAARVQEQNLGRLLDWLETQAANTGEGGTDGPKTPLRQISVPYRDRILIIPVERLLSAEINEGITRLFVLDDGQDESRPRLRQHVVNYTLDQLEANLDPDDFMRVHRSAIVQLDHIREMIPWFSGRYKLVLTGEHEVIASRERSKNLKDLLML